MLMQCGRGVPHRRRSVRSGYALAGTALRTKPHVSQYMSHATMSGCSFLATDGKSVSESRAWSTLVVALASHA